MRPLPSQEFLRAYFHYEPDTGALRWKARPREQFPSQRGWKNFNTQFAGTAITTLNWSGYIIVTLNGKGIFRAHRLIWKWMTGDDPPAEIDHINHDKADNRWSNLRLATRFQSMANRKLRADSSIGLKGVNKHRGGFHARIVAQGKRYYFGPFKTAKDAHAAYCEAAQWLFGEFAREE